MLVREIIAFYSENDTKPINTLCGQNKEILNVKTGGMYSDHCMRFEVLTAVKKSMLVFWVVTPCGIVVKYQRFGGTYCPHLQGQCDE
jgi:hypothetical protein